MSTPLSVLMIEDNPFDCELIQGEITGSGIDASFTVVTEEMGFRAALLAPPDVVLADYNLPAFELFTALAIMKEQGYGIPIIVVTGHVGDELAAECIKRGASDYVLKDRMGRLSQAISVALEQRRLKQAAELARAEVFSSEARFRSLVQNSRDVVAVIDQKGLCTYISPAVEAVSGHLPHEVVGHSGFEFIHPDDVERIARHLEDIVRLPGTTTIVEVRTQKKAGGWIWIEIRAANHLNDPVVQGVIVNYHDITDRKEMEKELRQREALFAGAFRAARTGIALIAGDAYTYVDVNEAFCEMLGYTKNELMALNWLTITHPADREVNVRTVDDLVRGEHDVSFVSKRYVRKNGDIISVELSDAIVRGPDREPLYFVTHVTDVTERLKAERSLRESQRLLHEVVNNSPALIYIKDLDGRYLLVNDKATKVCGLTRAEIVGKTAADLFEPEVADAIMSADQRAFDLLEAVEVEEAIPDADGEMRSYLTVKFPLFDERHECYAVCGISTDITDRAKSDDERHRLQAQLRQAQKMEAVGQLAGGVAHDFNNILAVILNYAEFVREDTAADDPRHADVQEIVTAAERAATLVHQLLAFSRKEIVAPQVIDLNVVVEGMRELLARSIGEDITLLIDPAPPSRPIRADPGQLEQILLNLAVNARDSMPEGGTLAISTTLETVDDGGRPGISGGTYMTLRVADTGHGMDPQTAERIFEPFFTTKPRGEGTGLGLATVYGIVKQTGGGIYVDTALGAGTTFSIYLPVTEQAVPDAEIRPVPAVSVVSKRASVLVVEDEAPVRELVSRILTRNGFDVVSVGSGREALERCTAEGLYLDLLLTDVVMPEMSGKVLADQMSVLHPRIKTIYMSGYTDEIIAQRGVLDGGEHLIMKPFDAPTLVRTIRSVLDGCAA